MLTSSYRFCEYGTDANILFCKVFLRNFSVFIIKLLPRQRHRLILSPEEIGLSNRIKRSLLEQEKGVTQRIKCISIKKKKPTKHKIKKVLSHFAKRFNTLLKKILKPESEIKDLKAKKETETKEEIDTGIYNIMIEYEKLVEPEQYLRKRFTFFIKTT